MAAAATATFTAVLLFLGTLTSATFAITVVSCQFRGVVAVTTWSLLLQSFFRFVLQAAQVAGMSCMALVLRNQADLDSFAGNAWGTRCLDGPRCCCLWRIQAADPVSCRDMPGLDLEPRQGESGRENQGVMP